MNPTSEPRSAVASMAVPSAEFIDDELLTEIHLRLPVSSILRFRSVSKHWRRLLTDRRFTLRYDNKHSISPAGVFALNNKYISFDAEDRNPPPFPTLDFSPHPVRILQSCNGLLLCCNDINNYYYVINPTTNQFAVIPSVPVAPRFVGLAFHPTTCPRYKVVCILPSNNTNMLLIQIYSSETGEWKRKTLNSSFSDRDYGTGVYWNGAIYWARSCPNPSYFDLNLEQMRKLPLPSTMPEPVKGYPLPLLYFGESGGHLHMVHFVEDGSRFDLIVYEMLMDHSRWFVKYKVDLLRLQSFYNRYHDFEINDVLRSNNTHLAWVVEHSAEFPRHCRLVNLHVIDVVRGEEEEDTFMVLNIHSSIIRYNVLDKSLKKLFEREYDHYSLGLMEGHRYIQSLASL